MNKINKNKTEGKMELKTGYFALLKSNPMLVNQVVSVALGNPRYVKVLYSYKKLAPSWNLLKGFREEKYTEKDYIEIYGRQLSNLNPKQVVEDLYNMTNGLEPILCCHCGKQWFCHRHLLAEWLEDELGVEVREYGNEEYIRKDGYLIQKNKTQIIPVKEENKETEISLFV